MKMSCTHHFLRDLSLSLPTSTPPLLPKSSPPQFVSPPPYSPVKQTVWDMSLIIAINDAWLPRGLAAKHRRHDGKQMECVINANTRAHIHTRRGKQTHISRLTHGCRYNVDMHTLAYTWLEY